MKAKNIEVAVYDKGDNQLQIWGVGFTLPGTLYRDANGKIPESARNRIIKLIKKTLEQVEFLDEDVH